MNDFEFLVELFLRSDLHGNDIAIHRVGNDKFRLKCDLYSSLGKTRINSILPETNVFVLIDKLLQRGWEGAEKLALCLTEAGKVQVPFNDLGVLCEELDPQMFVVYSGDKKIGTVCQTSNNIWLWTDSCFCKEIQVQKPWGMVYPVKESWIFRSDEETMGKFLASRSREDFPEAKFQAVLASEVLPRGRNNRNQVPNEILPFLSGFNIWYQETRKMRKTPRL